MQTYLNTQALGRFESRNTGVQLGYTTTLSFPNLPSMSWNSTDWLTVNFYDDYSAGVFLVLRTDKEITARITYLLPGAILPIPIRKP